MGKMISALGALENARKNMQMKNFAKEVLLEENYEKFMKSYKFMYRFQLYGTLAGFIIPAMVILIITKNIEYMLVGSGVIGLPWMCIWLLISMLMPQGKIYRKFAKWYRKEHVTLDDLDFIFYDK